MKLEVSGVHCKSCKMLITDVLTDEGIVPTTFEHDIKTQKAIITLDTQKSLDELSQLIKSVGDYTVRKL